MMDCALAAGEALKDANDASVEDNVTDTYRSSLQAAGAPSLQPEVCRHIKHVSLAQTHAGIGW